MSQIVDNKDLKNYLQQLDIFQDVNLVDFQLISIETVTEERVIFFQDQKIEEWYLIVNGQKYPQVSPYLQELIQSFDYLRITDSSTSDFTFYQNQSPLLLRSQSFIKSEQNAQFINEPESEIQITSRQEQNNIILDKQKKIRSNKEQQRLLLKEVKGGEMISFKELKYYYTTGVCNAGTTLIKIGISQIQYLKTYKMWQNYQNSQDLDFTSSQIINSKHTQTEFDHYFNQGIQKYLFLKQTQLFQNISIDLTDQSFNLITLKKGQCIYKQNDIPKYIYFIKEGEVELLISQKINNNSSISISPSLSPKKGVSVGLNHYIKASILSQGSIFGEEEIMNSSMRTFTARAVSKNIQLYQISIFFFLDCLCRQNENLLEKLKLKNYNSQSWRNSQIDSIQKVQRKLNQIDQQCKSNVNLLKNDRSKDKINGQQLKVNLSSTNTSKIIKQVENYPVKQQRSQSHNKISTERAKKSEQILNTSLILPQLNISANSNNILIPNLQQNQIRSISQNNKSQLRVRKSKSKSIDQEENLIQSQVKNKQKILSIFKQNKSVLINQQFPSFEKPLIPISNGTGLGVKNQNKYLISSSNKQNRKPSYNYLECNLSAEILNAQNQNNQIKRKLTQNSSIMNLSQISENYKQNQNFKQIIFNIENEVQKDEIRISSIIKPVQIQLNQMKKQKLLTQQSNITSVSQQNDQLISRQTKDNNKSMDDIYANIDKPTHHFSIFTTNFSSNDPSRINSFRNPYLDDLQIEENTQRNSVIELNHSQIGYDIDKSFRVNSKLNSYLRSKKINQSIIKEQIPNKNRQLHIQQKQDINSIQNESKVNKDINNIYNTLERYRLIEKSPTKEQSQRKSEEYNQVIRDKIESFLYQKVDQLPNKIQIINDSPKQDINITQKQPLFKNGTSSRQSQQIIEQKQKSQLANKIFDSNLINLNTVQIGNNIQLSQDDNNKRRNSQNYDLSNEKCKKELNNTCNCRFCIPHYKQQIQNSQQRYQLQSGGCSLQYTNKKNIILKQATKLFQNINQFDQI